MKLSGQKLGCVISNNRVYVEGGELTESYAVETGEVKMSKQELIAMIENAAFEPEERDKVYSHWRKKPRRI